MDIKYKSMHVLLDMVEQDIGQATNGIEALEEIRRRLYPSPDCAQCLKIIRELCLNNKIDNGSQTCFEIRHPQDSYQKSNSPLWSSLIG